MNLTQITQRVGYLARKNCPAILTGIGIACGVACTVTAVRETPKAMILLEKRKADLDVDQLPPMEVVKTAAVCYIPAATFGLTSIICIVCASSMNAKRNAALATAYAISETALREYKGKVIETIGEKKEQSIRESIAKDKMDKNPVVENEIIQTDNGNTMCYDVFSGRYFKSDMEKLRRAVNDLNEQLLNEGSVNINDFYYLIGLRETKNGDILGWDSRTGQVRMDFGSELASNGTPCIVVDFSVPPRYDYYR